MLPPPPHSLSYDFVRKHYNFANLKKTHGLFLLSHLCYYTSDKWINTSQKRYLAKIVKLLQAFMSPSPPSDCNILTNEKT